MSLDSMTLSWKAFVPRPGLGWGREHTHRGIAAHRGTCFSVNKPSTCSIVYCTRQRQP